MSDTKQQRRRPNHAEIERLTQERDVCDLAFTSTRDSLLLMTQEQGEIRTRLLLMTSERDYLRSHPFRNLWAWLKNDGESK